MPTGLPIRAQHIRRLSRLGFARVLLLTARMRLLNRRFRAVTRQGSSFEDDRLLHLMRRRLACHEAIAALLPDTPEAEHVREVRAILRPLDELPRQFPRPEVTMVFDVDPALAEATRRRTFEQVASDRLAFTGMHLHFPGWSHLGRRNGGYQLVPDAWSHDL